MEYIKPLGIISTEFIAGLFSSFWPINMLNNGYGTVSGPDQYAESSQSQTKSLTYTPNTNYGLSHWECTGLIRGTASGSGNVLTIGADARGILDVKAIFGPIVWNISSLHSQISTTNTFLNATGTYNSTNFTGIIKVTDASANFISSTSQGKVSNYSWQGTWQTVATIPDYYTNATISFTIYRQESSQAFQINYSQGAIYVNINGNRVYTLEQTKNSSNTVYPSFTVSGGDVIQIYFGTSQYTTNQEQSAGYSYSIGAQTYASIGMANGINTFNINTRNEKKYLSNIVSWGTNKEYKNNEYTLSLSSPVSYNSQNNLYTSDHGW